MRMNDSQLVFELNKKWPNIPLLEINKSERKGGHFSIWTTWEIGLLRLLVKAVSSKRYIFFEEVILIDNSYPEPSDRALLRTKSTGNAGHFLPLATMRREFAETGRGKEQVARRHIGELLRKCAREPQVMHDLLLSYRPKESSIRGFQAGGPGTGRKR